MLKLCSVTMRASYGPGIVYRIMWTQKVSNPVKIVMSLPDSDISRYSQRRIKESKNMTRDLL